MPSTTNTMNVESVPNAAATLEVGRSTGVINTSSLTSEKYMFHCGGCWRRQCRLLVQKDDHFTETLLSIFLMNFLTTLNQERTYYTVADVLGTHSFQIQDLTAKPEATEDMMPFTCQIRLHTSENWNSHSLVQAKSRDPSWSHRDRMNKGLQ